MCRKNADAGAHAADARRPVELERALDAAETLGVVAPERPRARAGVRFSFLFVFPAATACHLGAVCHLMLRDF